MDRGAWPFSVSGVIYLVNSVSVCTEKREERREKREERREEREDEREEKEKIKRREKKRTEEKRRDDFVEKGV